MKKILALLILSLLIGTLYSYYNNNITDIKREIYLNKSLELKKEIKELIIKKQGNTAAITYVISQNKNIKKALELKDSSLINFNKIISGLQRIGRYKNIWIQIIDKDGFSFYRSWSKKTGDSVSNIRVDIAKMLIVQRPMNQISTGRFDMTFKTIIPINGINGEFMT